MDDKMWSANHSMKLIKHVGNWKVNEDDKRISESTHSGRIRARRSTITGLRTLLWTGMHCFLVLEPCSASAFSSPRAPTTRLGFLSFDLDDTLFSTSPTVQDANMAMIQYMNEFMVGTTTNATEFLQSTRQIRQGLQAPMTYTGLRKLTISSILQKRGPFMDDATRSRLVEDSYNVWEAERHRAATRHLFPDTLPMLQAIQDRYPNTCIAAITNGKGNPLLMPELANYFDFCVSGEDAHVFPHRKPHAGIYEIALQQYRARHLTNDDVAAIWCHVGDCLANDVGTSAECGAYAVWYAPEHTSESISAAGRLSTTPSTTPTWSTATKHDLAQRQTQAQAATAKIAVRISRLMELPDALDELVSSAAQQQFWQEQKESAS